MSETLRYVLGMGVASGASEEDALTLVEDVLHEAGIEAMRLVAVATLDRRADHPALVALASRYDVPLRGLPAERLAAQAERLVTPSAAVAQLSGLAGVAEAAALALAGPNGRLIVPKRSRGRLTAALALGEG